MKPKPRTRPLSGLVAALALSLLLVAPALAQDTTTATVTGGALTMVPPAVGDFAERSVTGVAQTTTATLATFSVADLRGTGAGWRVTASATQFDNGEAEEANRKLAAGSLTMSAPAVSANGTGSAPPAVETGPFTIDGGGAVLIASAAPGDGMGVYEFGAAQLTLTLPADVYAGSYTSDVTITVQAAP